jgi:hypothetical protein
MLLNAGPVFGKSPLLRKVYRSFMGRKKTYKTKAWAFVKQWRMKYLTVGKPEFLLLILGCQRSGTTLLERIFRTDLDAVVFGEYCELTIASDRTVWQPLDRVKAKIEGCNAKYSVAKPLFESDRACELLEFFPTALVLWVFREPPLVVNSMKNKWGNDFFEISRRVESDQQGNWRGESLFEEIERETAGRNPSIDERYALFWKKRNEIAFAAELGQNDRVLFLNYETLVKHPEQCIEIIMKKAGGAGVWRFFSTDANQDSLRKSHSLSISDETLGECAILFGKLNELSFRDFPFR